MSGNATVNSNHADEGGGVCFLVGHTSYNFYAGSNFLTMNENATITGNISVGNGGGVFMYSVNTTGENTMNSLTMNGQSSISNNAAGQNGGGMYMNMVINANARNILLLNENAYIASNTADENGGGIYINSVEMPVSSVTLNDASVITLNTASIRNGGGIYLATLASLETTGPSLIMNNGAPNGNGGGINTEDLTYSNLNTSNGTMFSGNTASVAFLPPVNAVILYPNIGFASISITTHPLNNYDINFANGEPLTFQVAYNANGGVGNHIDSNISSGTVYTILAPREIGIDREGYTFIAWNTEPDGGGTSYAPSSIIIISEDVTLYAQWIANPVNLYTVTYIANGGVGSHIDTDIPHGTAYIILSPQEAGIYREGYIFTIWNTQPDGGGVSYAPENLIILTENLILYAQWMTNEKPSCCKTCCCPCVSCCD